MANDVGLLRPWIGSGSKGEAFERAWRRCRASWLLSGISSSHNSDSEGTEPGQEAAVKTVGKDLRNAAEQEGEEEEEESTQEEESDASPVEKGSSELEEPLGRGSSHVGGASSGTESGMKAMPGASGPSSLQRDVLRVLLQLAAQAGSTTAGLPHLQQLAATQAGSTMAALLPAVNPADGLVGRRAAAMQLLAGASIFHEYQTKDGLFSIDIAVIGPSEQHRDPSEQGSAMREDEAPSMRSPIPSAQQSGGSGSAPSDERPRLRLVIEVDGPTHYMTTSTSSRHSRTETTADIAVDNEGSGEPRRPAAEGSSSSTRSLTGATALRNRCLARRGWAVAGLPWWQWDSMWGDDEAKERYLVELLLLARV